MTRGRLTVQNYRGVPVPRTLGLWLGAVAVLGAAAVAVLDSVGRAGWGALAGGLLVAAAGLVDDLVPGGPRGLRGHLLALAAGRLTTGIVKAVVAIASAIVVISLGPPRPAWARVAGVVLVAAATNVWNGLDVRPGRALKAFLLIGAVGPFVQPQTLPGFWPLWAGAWPALAIDLSERAMLGDAGANLLGFTAGLAMYLGLPDVGVVVAAATAAALNVLADTVTLSRLVDAAPPLRWLDRLGRRQTG